jgi:hypothetical protein
MEKTFFSYISLSFFWPFMDDELAEAKVLQLVTGIAY